MNHSLTNKLNLLRFLPERLPLSVLYGAFVVSFLLTVFFGSQYSQLTYPVGWRTPFLDNLTYLLDPLLIHFFGISLYGYLVWRYLKLTHSQEGVLVRIVLSIGPPILLIIISFGLEQLVFKPAFHYPRPGVGAQPLGNPWLINWIQNTFQLMSARLGLFPQLMSPHPENNFQDVPSGFALRQLTIFYLTIWITTQQYGSTAWLSRKKQAIVHAMNSSALGLVIFSRLYRANHSFFAMTVAAGVGTLLFWTFIALIYFLSPQYRERYRILLGETFAAYFALALPFFAYSNDVGRWFIFSVVFLSILAIAYLIPSPTAKKR